MWSPYHKQWFVLPRRMSKEPYDEVKDERNGANTIIMASPDFKSIKAITVGVSASQALLRGIGVRGQALLGRAVCFPCALLPPPFTTRMRWPPLLIPSPQSIVPPGLRGFSSAKFLPGSRDTVLIALKSEENSERDRQTSYFTIFGEDASGGWGVLMDEVELPGEVKFEGLEVLSWT